ncbi:hypothetical protein ACFSHP_23120 [Novosphingobium panipatense]
MQTSKLSEGSDLGEQCSAAAHHPSGSRRSAGGQSAIVPRRVAERSGLLVQLSGSMGKLRVLAPRRGLVLEGPALLWSLVRLLRPEVRRDRRWLLFVVFLAATFILGFVNSLVHAKDAWAMMPEAIFLSVIVFLGCAATWLGFSRFGKEEV